MLFTKQLPLFKSEHKTHISHSFHKGEVYIANGCMSDSFRNIFTKSDS